MWKKKKKQTPFFSSLKGIMEGKAAVEKTYEQIDASNSVENREQIPSISPPSPESQPVIGEIRKVSDDNLADTSSVLPIFTFIHISPGIFLAGSPENEIGRNNDEIHHEVTLTREFYLQTTPVTQKQWKSVMGENPSCFSHETDELPVENVSWYDCKKFIEKLNTLGNEKYRLPTESEWEYACRAGSSSACSEGEILELFCGLDQNLDKLGWYCGNSGRKTHPVALKNPNHWGLYDMHGNVMEWCEDWYAKDTAVSQKNPCGPSLGSGRVVRGGSWFSNAKNCRSASRFCWPPDSKSDFIGFRLVKEKK